MATSTFKLPSPREILAESETDVAFLPENMAMTPNTPEVEVDPPCSYPATCRARNEKAIQLACPTLSFMDVDALPRSVQELKIFNLVTSPSQPVVPVDIQPPRLSDDTASNSSPSYRGVRAMGPMIWPEHWGTCHYSGTEMPPESCLQVPSTGDHHDAAVNPSKYGHSTIFSIGVCYKLFWRNKPCEKGSKCPTRHEPLYPYEIKYFASIGQDQFLNNYANSYHNSDRDVAPTPTKPLPFNPTAESVYGKPRDPLPVASEVKGNKEVRDMLWRRSRYFYRTFRTQWQLEDEMYDYSDAEWSST